MIRKNKFLIVFLAVMLVFPAFAAGASGGMSTRNRTGGAVYIDYIAEKIWIIPDGYTADVGGNIIISAEMSEKAAAEARKSAGTSPQFMYSLRVVPDTQTFKNDSKRINTLLKEKWYPVHGGGIDIAKIIPANTAKPYFIAFREADDIFNNEEGFASRVVFQIAPRLNQKTFGSFLEYDAVNEKIITTQDVPMGVVYQFDLFPPAAGVLDSAAGVGIDVPAKYFSLGAALSISSAPAVNADGSGFARSKSIKFKIPKQPSAPGVKTDASGTNRKITGLKASGLQFSVADPDITADWKPYTGLSALDLSGKNFNGLNAAFPDIIKNGTNGKEVYRVWVRTAPSGASASKKTPASEPVLLEIPADWFE